MERGDGELELVRELLSCQQTAVAAGRKAHTDEAVDVDRFVAVGVHLRASAEVRFLSQTPNLDASSKDVDERFPLQALGELAESDPLASRCLRAERVLRLFELARLVICGPKFASS